MDIDETITHRKCNVEKITVYNRGPLINPASPSYEESGFNVLSIFPGDKYLSSR